MTGVPGGSRTAHVGRIARELVLWFAAAGGAICIALTVLAFAGGFSLIMFSTGSMSPTIPAGSVALVQRVSAPEIRVGDVVTVDRPGALPITHRVTGISDGSEQDQRIITMRGDANDAADPLPYSVTDVRIVRGSVPHLAPILVWFGEPIVLGTLTVAAAALVTWAFWPKQERQGHPDGGSSHGGAAPIGQGNRHTIGALATVLLASVAVWHSSAPEPAHAAQDVLTLTSSLAGTHVLDDRDPVDWDVEVDATRANGEGLLTVALAGSDATPGMRIAADVRSCEVAWSEDGCAQGESLLRPQAPLPLDGSWDHLLRTETVDTLHLRIALTAPDVRVASASATLTVRVEASGETAEASVNPTGHPLPPTGGGSWTLLAAPAAVLVGLGVAMLAHGRRGGAA